jgi:predicted metalloprotease
MGRRSDNVEDRRGTGFGKKAAGGGLGTIVLVLVAMYFGVDPAIVTQLTGLTGGGSVQQAQRTPSAEENKEADFVSAVLADTEDTWGAIFQEKGGRYQQPKLVLFSGMVQSACGTANAAVGPFYCPGDRKVYIDLDFYNDLKEKLGAPGDFAQAYVVAHEIGHHVQNLLGISDKVQALRPKLPAVEYNKYQVRLELQADCLAGIWANHANRARNIIEPGDIDEALNAASMIGDDRLQKRARGYVTPDSFTHGTSAQRVQWFTRGYEHGDFESCNTFQ